MAPKAEVYPLPSGDGAAFFLVLLVPEDAHPRDYSPATLDAVASKHPDLLRLIDVRTSGWKSIGFFPDHAPRLWECPVAADLIMDKAEAGSRIVDIGAGVNPLVPYLTAHGYEVHTVDPSERTREWPPKPDWTGWGFLDYAAIDMAEKSWNCPLRRAAPRPPNSMWPTRSVSSSTSPPTIAEVSSMPWPSGSDPAGQWC